MKIRTLGAVALLVSLAFAVSCQKEDKAWKDIPYEKVEAASDNVAVTINGVESNIGRVQLNAVSGSEAQLVMEDVIPGYSTLSTEVDLDKISDTSFDFSGVMALGHPFITLTRSTAAEDPFYTLSISGNITTAGKITLNAETKVVDASLAGTWNLKRDAALAENGQTPLAGPFELKWTVPDEAINKKLTTVTYLANMWGGMLVADVLNKVSFLENGNITAEYYTPESIGMYSPEIDKDAKTSSYPATTHDNWIASPAANYAFWFTSGNYLYIVPSPEEIAASQGETVEFDIEGLTSQLSAFGADAVALTSIAAEIIYSGIPVRFQTTADGLDLSLEKSDLDAVVKALLADPTKLDAIVEELKKGDNGMLISMGLGMLGVSNVSDILTLWNATTEFSLTLHLTK